MLYLVFSTVGKKTTAILVQRLPHILVGDRLCKHLIP